MNLVLAQHVLGQHGPHGDAYVHGFLAGLQCNPETLEPALWMNHVLWNGDAGSFDTAQAAREVVKALVREWETTERGMRNGVPGVTALILDAQNFEEQMRRAYGWVAGFFDAAYLDGYDFVGAGEGDQSAIAPFEVLLSAGVQRGYAGEDNAAYIALQKELLRDLLRDDLMRDLLSKLDKQLVRAYKHFRGLEPIELPWQEEA